MNRLILCLSSCCCVITLFGCAGDPRPTDWPEARALGRELPSYRAPQGTDHRDVERSYVEPEGEVTLRDAFAAALLSNPELATFAWEVRVREARALQASLPPNPEVEFEIEDFGGTGNAAAFDASETTVLFSQLIELGHKRRKRTRLVELDQDLAAWDYETARVAVLTSVARAFIETLSLQQRVELSVRNMQLAQEAFDAISKRVDAGAAPPLDRTKARVVVARAKIELQRRRRELQAARLELASSWGSRQPRFTGVHGNLSELKPIPSMEALSSAISQNPQVARWAAELTHRRARVDVERSKATPDVTVGVGAKHLAESDDTAAVIQFSLPLPIFDRNQGNVLASRYELAKARQAQRAAELRIGTALGRAYQQLAAAHEEVTALQSDVLPAAKRAYDDTNAAYTRRNVGYLDLLDAQRTYFEAQSQIVEALGAYHGAAVEVEGLIGRPLSAFNNKNQSTPDVNLSNTPQEGAQP